MWRSGQQEVAVAALTPCFYRAPTDNDRGGAGGSAYASRCPLQTTQPAGGPVTKLISCSTRTAQPYSMPLLSAPPVHCHSRRAQVPAVGSTRLTFFRSEQCRCFHVTRAGSLGA